MSNLYTNSKIKNKEYLGDINYFLEQRNMENMREVEKKMPKKQQCLKESKAPTKIRKRESIAE
jgi:ATP-binding cassette subfamily F protein 3